MPGTVASADVWGRTALHLAAKEGRFQCVQALLAAGADPCAADDKWGELPLHKAAAEGRDACVAALLAAAGGPRNRTVEARTKDGRTPLHLAGKNGRTGCAQLLLSARADADARLRDGASAIHLCSQNGHADCLAALLAYGGDATSRRSDGCAPTHLAAQSGAANCLALLLRHGADPSPTDSFLKTLLHLAAACESPLRLLCLLCLLFPPCHYAHITCLEVLLAAGAGGNLAMKDGRSPLHMAARHGHCDCVAALLRAGADPRLPLPDGWTPLHMAAENGHAGCVAALLAAGADAGAANWEGQTPAQLAAAQPGSTEEVVAVLQAAEQEGVAVQGYVGEHQGTPLPAATAGVSATAAAAAAAPDGAILQLRITDGSSVAAKVAQLLAHPDVDVAEPDRVHRMVPAAAAAAQAGAGASWGAGGGGAQAAAGAAAKSGGLPNDSACTNCNGVFTGTKPAPGTPAYTNYNDVSGHGTHTAGIIAAAGNNSVGITGVAWDASILVCAVESPDRYFYTSSLLDCFALCKAEGARVYSNSYYSDCEGGNTTPCFSQLEYDAIKDLGEGDQGALFVVAAGNGGNNNDMLPVGKRGYPASYDLPNIVSVAATCPDDSLAGFSTYGPSTVHLGAPGVSVLSSYYDTTYSYVRLSGTSMACPVVSGAAVLLWSAKPDASVAQVRHALLGSVDLVPALDGKVLTGGRLNVAQAMLDIRGVVATAQRIGFVATEEADTTASYVQGYFKCEMFTDYSNHAAACAARCLARDWCWYWTVQPATTLSAYCNGLTRTGSCLLVDGSTKPTLIGSSPGTTFGYKTVQLPDLWASPPPAPPAPPASPPRPPPPPKPQPPPPKPRLSPPPPR
ncbi:Extracellular basic protease [Micractinium conductrix]|uniref:Extracellular basic protease n=1 Tax=Micractinium conductrix TaxID=554055 RepID=A0A2P6VK21_9CHLO|nr:Extracellular basic protease [Micractinium conductrix]|eukprot:PSC74435.1 Extracellular basic protease [Micractinium conductrix]